MKRTPKFVFFIVFVLIAALAYTTIFGVYTRFGDRQDAVIRSAADIRFGIDIRGGVDVTFAPADSTIDATDEQIESVKNVIEKRMVGQGITDYEIYADTSNNQVIARFPWSSDDDSYDVAAAIEELGKTAMLEFRKGGSTTDESGKAIPSGDVILTGSAVASAAAGIHPETLAPVVELKLNDSGKSA